MTNTGSTVPRVSAAGQDRAEQGRTGQDRAGALEGRRSRDYFSSGGAKQVGLGLGCHGYQEEEAQKDLG